MVDSKMVERIRKLLALGTSPNQHEAEAALAKANQLMQEHQLSMSEVDVKAEGAVGKAAIDMGRIRSRTKWVHGIAHACAKLYDCTTIRTTNPYRKTWSLVFIGRASDIELAQITFDHLYKSWESISKHDLKLHGAMLGSKLFYNSHGLGFSNAINRRVDLLVEERQEALRKTATTGTALILVKGQEVQDYMRDNFNNLKADRGTRSIDPYGYKAGKERGLVVPLGGAIGKK